MGSASLCANKRTEVQAPIKQPPTTINISRPSLPNNKLEETTTSFSDIRKIYKFDSKILGSGHFGTVRLATSISSPSQKFAVKTIFKEKIKKDFYLLKRELEILRTLDHPNIVKFYETYQDDKFFHLVMEYCSGGELLERIVEDGQLREGEAAIIMRKTFSAVKYLHDKGICHRDLKPENFLFSHKGKDAEIKIIDFGLSKQQQFEDEQSVTFKALKTIVGTALYVAPEVLKGKYDHKCDNWSLGVIAYVLLSGCPPFLGETNKEIFEKVMKGEYNFNNPAWKTVSKNAKNFISKLITLDLGKRMTAEQALGHVWLKEGGKKEETKLDGKILELLRGFRNVQALKREAMRIIVSFCSEAEIKNLKETFRVIDKDHSGFISTDELKKVMVEIGKPITDTEVQDIMKGLPLEQEGQINYSLFIAATLDKKIYLNKEKIYLVFKHFDVENKNEITALNLGEAMARAGRKIQNNILEEWIKEIDGKNNGKISFDEFYEMMKDDGNH